MNIRPVQFFTIILTALALVPVGAHLLELPNKLPLDEPSYMVVQSIYRGWALLGVILIAATAANAGAAILVRRQTMPMGFAAAAAVLLAVTLVVFATWTFPANQVTNNWTIVTKSWQSLRFQWEYSHAANAILTFLALCSTTASSLCWSHGAP
jgi:hypothetical protein